MCILGIFLALWPVRSQNHIIEVMRSQPGGNKVIELAVLAFPPAYLSFVQPLH